MLPQLLNAKMNINLGKFLLIIDFFLVLTLVYLGYATNVFAQVPNPYVPCNDIRDEEFNSLRPYQASPCDEEIQEAEIYCGNDLIIKKNYNVTPEGGTCTIKADGSQHCTYRFEEEASFAINLLHAELPIMGNTQLVENSQNKGNPTPENLTSAQRMNEYVSWYLQGDVFKAEGEYLDYEKKIEFIEIPNILQIPPGPPIKIPVDIKNILTKESEDRLVNYSGPLNKLLPQEIQFRARAETIKSAGQDRHNQIVGCTLGIDVPLLGEIGGIPVPCYDERNALTDYLVQEKRLKEWENHIPPFESEFADDGKSFEEYWEKYREWRGDSCESVNVPNFVPVVGGKTFLFCANNPLKPDFWANLYPYIPLAGPSGNKGSTEDRIGQVVIDSDLSHTLQPNSEVNVSNISIDVDKDVDNLYFSHMEESAELASLLQQTYAADEAVTFDGNHGNFDLYSRNDHCDLLDVRWNSGDDLFGEYGNDPITADVTFTTEFSCDFGPAGLDEACYDDCMNPGTGPAGTPGVCRAACTTDPGTCEKEAYTAVGVYTRTPKAQENWQRLVSGASSVFKRFMPKFGPNGLNIEIKDLPGVTTAIYEDEGGSGNISIQAGDPESKRTGERADIFIPHLGGIQEYFQRGIQDALRPQELKVSYAPGYPSGVVPSGTCQAITDDSEPCSINNLLPHFNDDMNLATAFSQVCNKESSGYQFALNDNCLRGKTLDYSVGLFQINLLAHPSRSSDVPDSLRAQITAAGYPDNITCPDAFTYSGSSCAINDGYDQLRQICLDWFRDPNNNLQYAKKIYNESGFGPWAGAKACGIH